ncbi:MAG: phosphate ABC transporter substrate-binding protein [Methanomicrobiales archaeon]
MESSQTFMKLRIPALVALIGLVLAGAAIAGCTGQETSMQTLTVTGSTTVLPIAQKTADACMATHPNADIQVSGGGSSHGIQAVGEGSADIGAASRDLKPSEVEKYPDLVQHVIARDGIAVIVHSSNPVTTLTVEEVQKIYSGEITRWSDVGGTDEEIVVVGRDSASGTREVFQELVMDDREFLPTQLEKNSNGAVKQTVAQTPGAIGYVGLGYIDETVQAVALGTADQSVEPTTGNVVSGAYPIARSLNMFTSGPATGLEEEYLDFIFSSDGQTIIKEEGFIPVA